MSLSLLHRSQPEALRPISHRSSRSIAALTAALLAATLMQSFGAAPASADAVTVSSSAPVAELPVVTHDVSQLSVFDAELLRLTNAKRAEAGLPAFEEARGLTTLSAWWSGQEATGATSGKLRHNPEGMAMVLEYGASQRSVWGENVIKWSPATASAQTIFNAYWSSSTHRSNLLNATYRYVGINTTLDSNGVSWNTINFTDTADKGQTYDPIAAVTPIGHFEAAGLAGATVTLRGWAIDPDATTASQLKVTDSAADGTVVTNLVTAGSTRTDVGQRYTAAGAGHGFDYSYVAAGRGAHTVCATVVDQAAGYGDVALGCLAYQVGNPVGSLDTVSRVGSILSLGGWAVDPARVADATTVTITDKAPSGTVTTTKLVAGQPNSAVAAAVSGAGSAHGFSGTAIIAGVGEHTVCASTSGIGTPAVSTDLGCRILSVNPAQPVGALDDATATTRDSVTIAGWAADPDFPTNAVTVNVSITNRLGTTSTKDTIANLAYSTEVAGGMGRGHAFTATLPLSTDGLNTVCVSAVSRTDWHLTTSLGCKDVTVSWLTGWQDRLTGAGDAKTGRTLKVEGWALDRGALTATAKVTLAVTAPTGKVSSTTVQANTLRADVGRAIAGAGDNHGYVTSIPVAAAGTYQVCSTVISTRNVADSKALTCQSVTVK